MLAHQLGHTVARRMAGGAAGDGEDRADASRRRPRRMGKCSIRGRSVHPASRRSAASLSDVEDQQAELHGQGGSSRGRRLLPRARARTAGGS